MRFICENISVFILLGNAIILGECKLWEIKIEPVIVNVLQKCDHIALHTKGNFIHISTNIYI